MKRRLLLISGVAFSALFIFYSTTLWASDKENFTTGKELFSLNCAACHGNDLQGNPPTYPSLKEVSGRLSRSAVEDQIKKGKNMMPSFAHLSDEQREAIVSYLFTGQQKAVKAASAKQKGEMLVRSNCLSCHRLTEADPRPPEARWMEPAHLAGVGQRFGFDQFSNIINRGPCYMPSFSHLEKKEKEDIYAFLLTLEGSVDGYLSGRNWRRQNGKSNRMNRCGCM